MKNYTKRKQFGVSRKINSGPRGGVADSPYLQTNGNTNGFKRGGKNPQVQYNDYLNKAKDAKGQGDEVLEQFYLQHAEHYFRQLDSFNRGAASRKIINKDRDATEYNSADDRQENETQAPSTDFDDLASQLA